VIVVVANRSNKHSDSASVCGLNTKSEFYKIVIESIQTMNESNHLIGKSKLNGKPGSSKGWVLISLS
jgi:hypothetical protein